MTITEDIKDERLENHSTLYYKGRKGDSWTGEQSIDLDPYFGDSDGYFVIDRGGYSKKSKNEEILREYMGSPYHEELKLVADLQKLDHDYRHEGIFLYPYFELIDGTLYHKKDTHQGE